MIKADFMIVHKPENKAHFSFTNMNKYVRLLPFLVVTNH